MPIRNSGGTGSRGGHRFGGSAPAVTVVVVNYLLAETGTVTSTAPTNFLPNDTHQITYVARNVSGTAITPVSVTFLSSDTNKGTVNSTGLVTAVAAGNFTVTLTADNWITVINYTVQTPAPAVNSVSLTITSGTLSVGQTASITANALDSSGNAILGKTVTVASADTNTATVSPASGTSPFTATVTAVAAGGPVNVTFTSESKTAAYAVTVQGVTLVGYPYTGPGLIVKQDWNNYVNQADVVSRGVSFGVEGGGNAQPPVLSTLSFWDLQSDTIFGKCIGYSGATWLNTTSTTYPGRVAVHVAPISAASRTSNVWLRQFVRFDPAWTNGGTTGGSGSASYKMHFLRYQQAFRQSIVFEGSRMWTKEGIPSYGTIALVSGGTLPWHTTRPVSPSNGQGNPDIAPQMHVGAQTRPASEGGNLAAADGDGEWYEIIMHNKSRGVYGEITNARRRYTTGSAASVNPDTSTVTSTSTINQGKINGWMISASGHTMTLSWDTVIEYDMGINRNRQWDSQMTVYWGPYEVVDGTKDPDPFGIASTWPAGGGV